jgi:hypothetical protein
MGQLDAVRPALQTSVEERGLGPELWEIARQKRHPWEPRKHQAAGALCRGRRALGRKGIRRSEEDSIEGASIGQGGVAHTLAFSPTYKGAPACIVAPFGQQDRVRAQTIEVPAEAGSVGSGPSPDVRGADTSHAIAAEGEAVIRRFAAR